MWCGIDRVCGFRSAHTFVFQPLKTYIVFLVIVKQNLNNHKNKIENTQKKTKKKQKQQQKSIHHTNNTYSYTHHQYK
jgi:hypothetical protein